MPTKSPFYMCVAGFSLLVLTPFIFVLIMAVTPGSAATRPPVVVELFTSQSCSSCPPADALLAELAQRPEVVALAFHVDYWNRLGWEDPFSLPAATARQRDYVRQLRLLTAYTPQMVIDGRTDAVGFDRKKVLSAIADAGPLPIDLQLKTEAGGLALSVGSGSGEGRLLLVTFDAGAETRVVGGENAGRVLHDANIVRSLDVVGRWSGQATTLKLPQPAAGRSAAAVLLQASDGRILGAATVRLASSAS